MVPAPSAPRHAKTEPLNAGAVAEARRHRLDSSSALVQASLPKNNGARELVDPYVIVGTAAAATAAPPPHCATLLVFSIGKRSRGHTAQPKFFFLQLALLCSSIV